MGLTESMSEDNDLAEIQKLIDDMQARLVELFDQFRELRIRLGQKPPTFTLSSTSKSTSPKAIPETDDEPKTPPSTSANDDQSEKTSSAAPETKASDSEIKTAVKVSRLLDPISHELSTGSSPAEVIAEYLQAAKDELISKEEQNDKVARDIDIVLKFLRARGRRSIRPEERDNILRRIKRWKAHLSK